MILDPGCLLFANGNMDECDIKDLLSQGAPIDGFGADIAYFGESER